MNIAGLKFDDDFHPIEPTAILTTRSGKKIGLIQKTEFRYKGNLSSADEISFSVHRNAASDEVWNGLKDFRLCWIRELDAYFEIAVTIEDSDGLVKKVTGVSLGEAELSQTNLYGVEINTEKEITNDVNYSPTVFYDESNENHSLMHRLLKGTCYRPGNVDECLWKEQRSFSFNNTSIKDGFDEVAKELKCLFVFRNDTNQETGKINRVVDAYNLDEERKNADGSPASVFGNDTGIFISDENIARRITLTTNTGNVKNCFKLEGGDDAMTAAIASVNPTGTSFLWYISSDMRETMSDALRDALDAYDETYAKITGSDIVILGNNTLDRYLSIAYNNVVRELAGEIYVEKQAYSVGDKINKDGTAYMCNEEVFDGEEWNKEKWAYVYGEHSSFFHEIQTRKMPKYDAVTPGKKYIAGEYVYTATKRNPASLTRVWNIMVYECLHDFCYDDIPEPKEENDPGNFTEYWQEHTEHGSYALYSNPDIEYGFAQNMAKLSEYIYNAIDIRMFLTDTMMPDYNIAEMNQSYVNECLNYVVNEFSREPIGIFEDEAESIDDSIVKRAAENMIKALTDARLTIKLENVIENVEEQTVSDKIIKLYTGDLTLYGTDTDGDEVSAAGSIRIAISNSYKEFIEQKIDKALSKKLEKPDKEALDEVSKYKGVYADTESYSVGDIVWHIDRMYTCVAAIKLPDEDDTNWTQLAADAEYSDSSYKGEYSVETSYLFNDVVSLGENKYQCINQDGVNEKKSPDADKDETNWQFLDSKIRMYSVAELDNLYNCCDGCMAVLVEQGATGSGAVDADDYYKKYHAIMQALLVQKEWREDEAGGILLYIDLLRRVIKRLHDMLNMENALGDNMDELISYRRDSVYSNSNFISDGLTNHEIMERASLFFDDAVKEIYKSAERQHSISSDIYNLLAIKEFESVRNQFALGNWIREKLDGEVYKLRLIGYELNFTDLTTLAVEFSDLIRADGSVSDVKSILDRAKSVSSTYGFTARQADRGGSAKEELNEINKNGINVGDVSVFGNDKSIQWTQGGFILREYDELTNTYSPIQMKLLATGIYRTTDNWKTVTKII